MLEEIADQLYALPADRFTAARDEAARADRALAKQIKALRKPTASAHLVNQLVRAEPVVLQELLALGPALAQAQRDADADALRELGRRRRQLVDTVTDQVVTLSDAAVSAAVRAEVVSTLEAGLADPAAAEAVRSGRLVRALQFAGFGGADLTDAVAAPGAPPRSRDTTTPRKSAATAVEKAAARTAAAEQVALRTAGELDDAVRRREAAVHAQEAAAAETTRNREALARLRAQVAEAERSLTGAERAEQSAAERVDACTDEVLRAQEAAEQARKALDALRRG